MPASTPATIPSAEWLSGELIRAFDKYFQLDALPILPEELAVITEQMAVDIIASAKQLEESKEV